jgi:hypothetical protein
MTDEWWWAQFGHKHGPISLSELKEKLQGVDLREIFVWRAGFHEWREAGTVPELDIVEPPHGGPPTTNYEPLIAHAVSKLDKSTGANRQILYERARSACIEELKKRDPPISDMDFANERAALENAIRKVESDWETAATTRNVIGVVGFVLGFGLTVALEVLLLGGLDYVSGDEFLPRGLGWIAMPIAAGIGGWRAFQEIDFIKVARSIAERALTETGIPQSKRAAALALIAAIGWVVGTLTGFFVTLAEGHHDTLAKWLFGEWGYGMYDFPWLGIGWGIAGVVFAFAIIYARQLLSNVSQQG